MHVFAHWARARRWSSDTAHDYQEESDKTKTFPEFTDHDSLLTIKKIVLFNIQTV